eukprot:CAMPEP_0206155756 /NCGR_PEP_ID=MMETSP1474-20131121/2362_1 /ASSEMBLY_ACC=CAM_ASM_001110 /TAXON_ID=97495 /ORGANISM="Imantonia sp., Strain RCC918" /LENGTH=71 /DNA_ID=CAMNT_0053554517 /DNA_START=220 /DNA_END=435 /DNA_ORIENTATION=+
MALAAPDVVAAAALAAAMASEPAKSRIGSMLTGSGFSSSLRKMLRVATTLPLAQRSGCSSIETAGDEQRAI